MLLALAAVTACTQQGSLQPLPSPPPPPPEIPDEERWVDIVAHPCALNAAGELHCFFDPEVPTTFTPQVPHGTRRFEQPSVPLQGLAWMRGRYLLTGWAIDGQLVPIIYVTSPAPGSLWGPRPFDDPSLDEPVERFTAWGGVTADGRTVSFADDPRLPQRDWLLLSDDYFVGLDVDHVLHMVRFPHPSAAWAQRLSVPIELDAAPRVLVGWFNGYPSYPSELLNLDPNIPEFYACVLDVVGEIRCVTDGNFGHVQFPNPPYAHLVSDRLVVCAQRATDHVVECSNGTERPFEPVRKLAVGHFSREATGDLPRFEPTSNNPPGSDPLDDDTHYPICGITYDNRIRCDSPYYDNIQHLLEALP